MSWVLLGISDDDGADDPQPSKDDNENNSPLTRVRERYLPFLTTITIVLFVLFILVVSSVIGYRHEFDTNEEFENVERAPFVLAAVPIGDEMIGVVYFESNDTDSNWDYPNVDNINDDEIYLMVLDGQGRFIHDRIPVKGLDVTYDDMRNHTYLRNHTYSIYGTSTGVAFLHNGTPDEDGMPFLSFHVDATSGERSESVEVLPGMDITDYEFSCTSQGDTIHVVMWRARNVMAPSEDPAAIYVRTTDEGRSWDDPIVLLNNETTVGLGFPVARQETVSIVLLETQDPDQPLGWIHLTLRSIDGGATFMQPQGISGFGPPEGVDYVQAGIGSDGTMLILAQDWDTWGLLRTIYHVDPSGHSNAIHVPEVHRYVSIGLARDEEDPLTYSVDQFVGTYFEGKHYYVKTFDLEGELVGSDTYDRWDGRIGFPARVVDGSLQGIDVARIGTSRDCFPRSSGEIRLMGQDPSTNEKEMIGRPYEVVFVHTDATKQALTDRVDYLIPTAWTLWLLFIITAMATAAMAMKPSIKPSSPATIRSILFAGCMILLVLLASSVIYRAEETWYYDEFQAFAVFFAAMGMFTVEVIARMGDRLRFARVLHIPFSLLILLAAGDYAIYGMGSIWYTDFLMILKSVLWIPMVLLVVLSIWMVTKRGDIITSNRQWLWYGPVHGLMFILALMMPVLIYEIMYA
ncbi:MAG: hypothetical protein KAJ35_01660 [Thermoplasmata archaeon]|nr:hypothetical protein [Thermoplasmata archaeon]